MKLHPNQYSPLRQPVFIRIFWWTMYLLGAVWMQEISDGRDFFSPGVLICLQTRQWWGAGALALLFIFLHEGVGTLAFGTSILFYTGLFIFFFTLNWWLDPESPLFILCLSLGLAGWLYLILAGAISFQELPVQMPDPGYWILTQAAAYLLTWIFSLALYRQVVWRGRV